jgi:hypothetical protein
MTLSSIAGVGLIACGVSVLTQTSLPEPRATTLELQEFLFVQKPDAPGARAGVQVVWIPQPVQKYCLGKTLKECASIDYCIRTTNKNVAMCRNLSVDATRVPAYPPDVRPARVLSVTYFVLAGMPGFDALQRFLERAPKETLDHLSLSARIRAKIKFTRSREDDDFKLMEVLAVPPF